MDVLDGELGTMQTGDVFVLKADRPLSHDQHAMLREMLTKALPAGTSTLILDDGLEWAIVRPPRAADWYVTETNDRAFITDQPPRPELTGLDLRHIGPELALDITALPELARTAIVTEHNRAIASARADASIKAAELRNTRESFTNAIAYALNIPDGQSGRGFLDLWTHGEFDTIARTYPDFVFGNERL